MKNLQKINKQIISPNRKSDMTSLIKLIILAFLGIGTLALLTSIVYVSSILAFIGLGLVFWGAILFYIQPDPSKKEAILDATAFLPFATLNQMIQELNYGGKAVYIPTQHLKDAEISEVYISKLRSGTLPDLETILNHEKTLFIDNPEGILLTPPCTQLVRLFEKRLDTNFAKTDLNYIVENMPKLLVDDLEIAESVEIETKYNEIQIRITSSAIKEAQKEFNKSTDPYKPLGCSLLSAIACSLTKVIGKPIVAERYLLSNDGRTIETTYRILGIVEPESFLPSIQQEEFRSQIIPIQTKKNLYQNLASLLLTVIGSILIAQVTLVALNDMTVWGKDVVEVFFSSRTGEMMSLGIGMKVIHHFLIGLVSIFAGAFTYFLRRRKV